MLSTHFVGEITEQQVVLEFLKLGIMVSKPLVQSSKYDYIVDINNKLYKIQIKTGTLKENSHIDFATMFDNQCYLVPISLCGKRNQRLRIAPTKNKQTQGVLFAKDFKLEDIIKGLS